jgi:hypothetical protein
MRAGARHLGARVANRLRLGVAGRRGAHPDHGAWRPVHRPLIAQQLFAVDALLDDHRHVTDRVHRLGPQHLVWKLQIDRELAVQLAIAHRALVGAGTGEPLHLVQVLLAAKRLARLREQLLRLGIAFDARRDAAERHRERDQRNNQSLHVITSCRGL